MGTLPELKRRENVFIREDGTIDISATYMHKPSLALIDMCNGLERQQEREDFIVDMGTYGRRSSVLNDLQEVIPICFGCAATCTIQELAGKHADFDNVMYREKIGFHKLELLTFESCIDEARHGELEELFKFCGLNWSCNIWDGKWGLYDDNWQDQIPLVRDTIRQMEEAGY